MKDKKVLCFDLDDTLIDDNYKFELTFCRCIEVIIQALETSSPQIDDILQVARDHDNHLWETLPKEKRYMPSRVATSWMNAYEEIAKSKDIPVRPHIKRLLWSLVMTNYDPPYYVIPGVIETLKEMRSRGYDLQVITVGHENIQRRKLTTTHLIKYFNKYHVVPADKKAVLEEISNEYGKENITMIGNSMRSDVNPALELGIKVIYIPKGSWSKFKAEPINSNYIETDDIQKIKDYL